MNKDSKSNKSKRKLSPTKKEIGGPKGPEPTTISNFFLCCLLAH